MWLFCDLMRLCYFSKWTWIFACMLKLILKSVILWYELQKIWISRYKPNKGSIFITCILLNIVNLALLILYMCSKWKIGRIYHMRIFKTHKNIKRNWFWSYKMVNMFTVLFWLFFGKYFFNPTLDWQNKRTNRNKPKRIVPIGFMSVKLQMSKLLYLKI